MCLLDVDQDTLYDQVPVFYARVQEGEERAEGTVVYNSTRCILQGD